jgi:hypothetical protein
MFRMAEESTKITMADYDHSERSMLFNRMGMMGKMAAALKTYPTNMVGQLILYTKEASKGNWKPLAYFLGMQMAVGGLRGMFAVDDLDAAWSFIKRHLMPAGIFDKFKEYGIKKFLVENLVNHPEWYHGPISAFSGLNISVPGSMGRIIPGFKSLADGELMDAAKDVFPSVSENLALGKAIVEFGAGKLLQHAPSIVPRPTPNETNEAYFEAAPGGLKGAVRENAIPGIDNPAFHAPGQPDLMMNPHKLEEGEYRRNAHEHELGKYGFTSPREQTIVDAAHSFNEMKSIMAEHRKEVVRDLEEYALKGDSEQVRRLMILYWDLGGQVDKVPDEIKEAALKKITDMRTRASMALQTSENATQIKIARDFLNSLSPPR